MSEHSFTDHTAHSAPDGSRRLMEAVTRRLGYLPSGVARMAASPQLLEGFLKASALFEASSLEPLAQEVVIMVIAARNGCHVCVTMHTAKLRKLGADEKLIDALRRQRSLDDPRLEAVRAFTLEALATAGAVPDEALEAFLAQGWTESNALDVVLGIGTYTLSTFANRLVRAPLDGPLAAFA